MMDAGMDDGCMNGRIEGWMMDAGMDGWIVNETTFFR